MIIQIFPPPGAPPPNPPGLPIDNGIVLLFFVGLVYGILVIRSRNKKTTYFDSMFKSFQFLKKYSQQLTKLIKHKDI